MEKKHQFGRFAKVAKAWLFGWSFTIASTDSGRWVGWDFWRVPIWDPRNSWRAGLLKEVFSKLMFKGGYIIQFLFGGDYLDSIGAEVWMKLLCFGFCVLRKLEQEEKSNAYTQNGPFSTVAAHMRQNTGLMSSQSRQRSRQSRHVSDQLRALQGGHGPRQVISRNPRLPFVESGFPCTRALALGRWSWWMNRAHAFEPTKTTNNPKSQIPLSFHSGAISTSL